MEVAVYIFGALAVVCGFLVNVLADGNHRSQVVWISWLGVVLTATAGACWFQDRISKSAENAKSSTETSLNIARAESRAYMGAGRPDIKKFKLGKPVDCTVTYVNTGKTPAKLVESSISMLILPADAELSDLGNSDMQRIEELPIKATIHPGQPMSIKDEKPPTMTKELMANLNNGTQKLFVTSAIYYRDVIEDKLRIERICYYWDRHAKVLYAHDNGNQSD